MWTAMALSLAIFVAVAVFQICVLRLLAQNALWRVYPFFSMYVIWISVSNSALLVAYLRFLPSYSTWYWQSDSIDVLVRLLVVWEVFRQTFPKGSALNRSLSKGLGIITFCLVVFACITFWGYQNYNGLRSRGLALDRSFGFVQAAMILGTLLMARYYSVKYGRNVRGIALAFGGWVSISAVSSAMVELTNSFLPYWYYLRPLSFVAMMVALIWALWVYEPNPPINGLALRQTSTVS
jgi:hypothetical protein